MTPDRPDGRGRRRMPDGDGDARRRDGAVREEHDPSIPVDGDPPAAGIGVEVEEPDASRLAAALGRVGVYLGVAAVGVAALGIALGAAGAGLHRVAFVLALALGVLSMVLASVFQASAGGLLRSD